MPNSARCPTDVYGSTQGGAVVRLIPPPRHGNALAEHLVERIVALGGEGLPRVVIRERLGLNPRTIIRYLQRAGFPLTNRGRKCRANSGG